MPHRRFFVLSLIVGLPAAAAAQFTTFIPPQTKPADSVRAPVATQKAVQPDTSLSTRLTNLKTWVDSAAGVAAAPKAAQDSLPAKKPVPTVSDSATAKTSDTATMRNGERAPATASDLPMMALIGSVALGLGALLLGAGGNRRIRTDA